MPQAHTDTLVACIADFDFGNDLSPTNPFDIDDVMDTEVMKITLAFVSGSSVPATMSIEAKSPEGYTGVPLRDLMERAAHAAFLQGLAVGFEYAARCCPAQP